jgi:hypothetical protein
MTTYIRQYLNSINYKNILNAEWYFELKENLEILEKNKIYINISELNKYLHDRYLFETNQLHYFDNNKYNPIKFMVNDFSGYDADNEQFNDYNINSLSNQFNSFSFS